MLSRRLAPSRIPLVRLLRPPNRIPEPPGPRLFTQNTQLLLVAHRATRPQLPYLTQPTSRLRPTLLGPNPQLARLISTENRRYVGEQIYLAAKWTVIGWTFLILTGLIYVGFQVESEERSDPTPDEWSFWTRWYLRGARRARRKGMEDVGFVDWAAIGDQLEKSLKRLEDTTGKDGKGVLEVEEGGILIPEVGRAGFDVSAKSWPWRSGYYEAIMGCAAAAEHMENMVLDRTRGLVFPKDVMIGPSNPDPRPVPVYMKSAPLEENCERAFDPPETYYMRVLTTKGFTTKQKLDAALGYAAWLEYKGLSESAEEMYIWGFDIAKAALPISTDPSKVVEEKTAVLKPDAKEATPNLLRAVTSLAIHHARTGNVSTALPILLSVLRARRDAPVSPFSQPMESTYTAQGEAKTDFGSARNIFTTLFRPPQFPPPPPSGDFPLVRLSDRPTCEESELMLYIGEILFTTSPQSLEGMGWTRQGVMIAEANLQSSTLSGTADAIEKAKCKQCLVTGVSNWETMLRQLSDMQTRSSLREGGRNAGLLEFRGWFGKDGGTKGKTLNELSAGVLETEIRQVELLKEKIAREGINEEMAKVRSGPSGSTWIG